MQFRSNNTCAFIMGAVLTLASLSFGAEPKTIPLWPDGPPSKNGLTGPERAGGCIGNISVATLTVHLPPKDKATGQAVVITPGGGYGVVCADTEGKQIADILVPRGIAAVVLKYRLPNGHHLIPAQDARRALQTVRHHAKAWGIRPNRVGIWGFSAGGHLASTVSTAFEESKQRTDDPIGKESSRPDFSILFYPVISMETGVTHNGSRTNLLGKKPPQELLARYSNEEQVSRRTPPTFLLHAADDRAVPIENSLRYYRQLVAQGVPARLVAFETGGHGPGAFKKNPSWLGVFEAWIMQR